MPTSGKSSPEARKFDLSALIAKEREAWIKAIRSLRPKEGDPQAIKISATAPPSRKPPLVIVERKPPPISEEKPLSMDSPPPMTAPPAEKRDPPLAVPAKLPMVQEIKPPVADLPPKPVLAQESPPPPPTPVEKKVTVVVSHPVQAEPPPVVKAPAPAPVAPPPQIETPSGPPLVSALVAEALQSENQRLYRTMEDFKEQVERLAKENTSLKEQAAAPPSSPPPPPALPDAVMEELEETRRDNRELRKRVEVFEAEQEAAGAVDLPSADELETLRIENDALKKKVEMMRGRQDTTSRTEALEAENSTLRIQMQALQKTLDEVASNTAPPPPAVIRDSEEFLAMKKRADDLAAQVSQLQSEQASWESGRAAMKHAEQEVRSAQASAGQALDAAKGRTKELEGELAAQRASRERDAVELAHLKHEFEEQRKAWEQYQIEQTEDAMAARLKTLESRLALQRQEFQDRVAALTEEHALVKKHFDQRVGDEVQWWQAKEREDRSRIEQLTAALQQLEVRLDEARRQFNEDLHRRLQEQEAHLRLVASKESKEAKAEVEWAKRQREEEIQALRARREQEVSQEENAATLMRERAQEIERLRAEAVDAQKLFARLRNQLTDVEHQDHARESGWRQRVAEVEDRLLQERAEGQKARAAVEEQQMNLQIQFQSVSAHRDQLEHQRAALEQTMLAERQRSKEAEEAFLKAQLQLKEMTIEAREQEFTLEKNLQELRGTLEGKDQELRFLKNHVKSVEEGLQSVRAAAERQVGEARDQMVQQQAVVKELLIQQEAMTEESQKRQQEIAQLTAQFREQASQLRAQMDEYRTRVGQLEQEKAGWDMQKAEGEHELKTVRAKLEMESSLHHKREEEVKGLQTRWADASKSGHQHAEQAQTASLKIEELTHRIDYLEKMVELKNEELRDLQKAYQQAQKMRQAKPGPTGLGAYLADIKKELGP